MNNNNRTIWIIVIAAVVIIGCICVAVTGVLGTFLVIGARAVQTVVPQMTIQPQITLDIPGWPTSGPDPDSTPAPFPTPNPVGMSGALQTLKTLDEAEVPNNDPRELALRLKGIANIPETVSPPATPYKLGDTRKFWASNTDTNNNFEITAELISITENAYIWAEEGVRYDQGELEDLAATFQDKIYPTNRKFFGSEWSPGIDGDPRVYIIFARNLGGNLAGYFSSADEMNPLAHPYSNAIEAFFMNADNVSIGEEAYGILAHEFQHMIHWYRDRNEESWVNEGFSELADLLNGFYQPGFDVTFSYQPDQQLNDWPNNPGGTTPYYGSSFLFVSYFLDRFGDEATQAVVYSPDNGLGSIDRVLQELNVTDPTRGEPVTADDVFADWVVTNYVQNDRVGDGRYNYKTYTRAPSFNDTETITNCPVDWKSRQVHQYGADYIRLDCSGQFTLEIQGGTEVGVLPEGAHSGDFAFWSNKGDESDMMLTREFDFTNVSAPIEISYWTWYDLEKDYDYLFLEASTDGQKWEILKTPSGTDENPSGNSFGWGYNGVTDGWIEEKVDLSKFAGQKVQLRFEYVTDAAVNGEGLLLDDIAVEAVNYQTDFESDDGGWTAAGFVRIENRLPQTFRISLIRNGDETTVETLTLDDQQMARVALDFGGLKDAVLVVSGTTRFTRQEASYQFRLQP